jgi:hypothetical protein
MPEIASLRKLGDIEALLESKSLLFHDTEAVRKSA